jgi:hypothetical protein
MFWACTEAVPCSEQRRTYQCQMCGDVRQYVVPADTVRLRANAAG